MSPSAVAKTIKRYKEPGSHEDRPRKGRPRVTSASENKFIRFTSLRNCRLTAAQIRDQVNATQSSSSRHISTTTVKGTLCAAGLNDTEDMVGLAVSPEISLVDEPVKIQAWGLPPDQVITLAAWLKDEKGLIFHSRAFYKTDMEGKVDLEKTPATGGDFHGVCPMGLFWALKPKIPFKKLNKRDVVGSPFLVHIDLYSSLEFNVPDDCPAATKVIERWYAAPGVQRISIREGRIRGALFLPPGEGPFVGIIDMFGGVGGLLEFRSSLLASRGFATLALAYFYYDDLPLFLGEVDLKYFEEAAQFLCNHPKVS
ncbi:unnamed protein product [Ranitomeya imitator]|uniref:Acyl-CoA thioester hydrolase/bile acid-CoA amino acid N-acetyltransferase domain-containing protein n=1 Tax=Ranitomeya imitator TaxID=111125 RepID=A0ABN9LND3_9NEOB|nr:unnamed protein product [Ranitomeya imitator]